MSKNAMAGAVTLCGVGLCLIGGALMMQSGNSAQAGSMTAAAAVASTANAQVTPTIVWYGLSSAATNWVYQAASLHENLGVLARAWSDGRVEARTYSVGCGVSPCGGWVTVSDPNEGFRAIADVNADELVDAIDLASILSNWGDAPRVPFPPSDCPLNLINP